MYVAYYFLSPTSIIQKLTTGARQDSFIYVYTYHDI